MQRERRTTPETDAHDLTPTQLVGDAELKRRDIDADTTQEHGEREHATQTPLAHDTATTPGLHANKRDELG